MGRWSIAGMLGLVAVVGVSLAALREASLVWAAAITPVVGVILAFTAIMAILRRGHRAGWIGFAALGIPYFIASLVLNPAIGPLHAVTLWIDRESARLDPHPPPMRDALVPRHEWMKLPLAEREARVIRMNQDSERGRVYDDDLMTRREATRSIAHSLLSLIVGGVGALLGGSRAWLLRPGPRSKKAEAPCP